MSEKIINVKVFRFNPEIDTEPRYEIYKVPVDLGMNVFNVLEYINENFDGGLAHYISCRRGICMGCTLRVNGKPKRTCIELATEDMTLEPLNKDKVIKDLISESNLQK